MNGQMVEQQRETITPQLDWVVLRKLEHEDRTESGLIIPELGDIDRNWLRTEKDAQLSRRAGPGTSRAEAKHKAVSTGRYVVLDVGPGDFTDYSDEHGAEVFLRKPMQAKIGDVVLVRDGTREIFVDGETLYLAQDYMLLATITVQGGKEVLGVLNNYVFAAPATNVALSKGGIALVEDEDYTGNVRFGAERYTALGVGEGAYCLLHEPGRTPRHERRPLPVQNGDVFAAHGVGFGVSFGGAVMTVLMSNQIAAVFGAGVASQ